MSKQSTEIAQLWKTAGFATKGHPTISPPFLPITSSNLRQFVFCLDWETLIILFCYFETLCDPLDDDHTAAFILDKAIKYFDIIQKRITCFLSIWNMIFNSSDFYQASSTIPSKKHWKPKYMPSIELSPMRFKTSPKKAQFCRWPPANISFLEGWAPSEEKKKKMKWSQFSAFVFVAWSGYNRVLRCIANVFWSK